MSASSSSHAAHSGRHPATAAVKKSSPWILIAVAVVTVIIVAWTIWKQFPYRSEDATAQISTPSTQTDDHSGENEQPSDIVELSREKQQVGGLHVTAIQRQMIQPTLKVPGRLDYNRSRYLEVKSPTDGVVGKVLVKTGQTLAIGDHLATMLSPEVGQARDAVKHSAAELQLAERRYAWANSVAANVDGLIDRLETRPAISEIEAEFKSRPLGKHREAIIAAYSKLLLAEFTLAGSESLGDQGVLSTRTMQERRSQREIATAAFVGACETSRYEADLQRDVEKLEHEHATHQVELSREKLRTLFGPDSDNEVDESGRDWGAFELHASIDGVVAERRVVDGERVANGQALFVLADVRSLYVMAHLRQQQWEELQLAEDAEVTLQAASSNAPTYTARVRYVASLISPDSHSLPLVAEFDNADGRLKPGMFVWVTLPSGPAREALVVPASSFMRHENETFVFVRESAERFRRIPVQMGLETQQGVEVLSELEPGMEVVDAGAFVLKSEWLLDTVAE